MAFDMNPKANTYPDVAKNQHLVPRTYMREWSAAGNDSVWIYDKTEEDKGIQPKNVDTINCKRGFHDIKAGDIFIPDEALKPLFGFLKKYKIKLNGIELKTLRELSDNYYEYDQWQIYDDCNNIAGKKVKNSYKKTIEQSRYVFIEKEWGCQFENSWQTYIHQIEEKVRCKILKTPYVPNEEEIKELMEQILVYDFRNINGNAWINSIIDNILPEELANLEIPVKERVHLFNSTADDEMKHAVRIKAFYEFLKNRNGKIIMMLENYLKNLHIEICLTDNNFPFLTCDTPSMMIKRIDNLYEHIFIATPTMLVTTFKSDRYTYARKYLSPKEVKRYNKYIIKNSNLIITRDNTEEILKLIKNNS